MTSPQGAHRFANPKRMGETLHDYSKIGRLTKQLFSEEAIFDRFDKFATTRHLLPKEKSFKRMFKNSSRKAAPQRVIIQDEREEELASRHLNNSVDVPSITNLSPGAVQREVQKYDTHSFQSV
mmetsp:Transcript_16643/g.25653  ORF Transcript_16643/g.25653 Transcript_16643/m.25653 type:complete len:123 (+) Transcript_16643:383-751(+)